MKIVIDCMGGDRGPGICLSGVEQARRQWGHEYLLVGEPQRLKEEAARVGVDLSAYQVEAAPAVVEMTDDPLCVMRSKADSSMNRALKLLSEGQGDAVVSCGNTGALFVGGTLLVRKQVGVHRAAIATILPFRPPILMLDAGANVTVQPEYLFQFALMGSAYSSCALGVDRPRVGLLNNGAEEHKGTPIQVQAYTLLKECPSIRFVGNVEASALPFDACDVLVADGFTGNVLLKNVEGIGRMMSERLKKMFYATPFSRLAALAVKDELTKFKKDFDAAEYGGSPLLGLRKLVVKAHGSSNEKAFKNAIGQAIRCVESEALTKLNGLFDQATSS